MGRKGAAARFQARLFDAGRQDRVLQVAADAAPLPLHGTTEAWHARDRWPAITPRGSPRVCFLVPLVRLELTTYHLRSGCSTG